MRKMGKSSDICAAVIDDLTFDPQYVQAAAVTARAIGVRCVRNHLQVALSPGDHRDDLTGIRRVRNDIQIRGLEQA